MAKIAVDVEEALRQRAVSGARGHLASRLLARGDGWVVEDVVCTCGPQDRSFEERHASVSIAIVVAGSFQYRADSRGAAAAELMTPGALMLGNPGQYFECRHAHGAGDRCISFRYDPAYFARIADGERGADSHGPFRAPRLPPLRALSPAIGLSCATLVGSGGASWEEIGVELTVHALRTANGHAPRTRPDSSDAVARVTHVVRQIERRPDRALTLGAMARSVDLSPYHFLRVFERVAGVTPHQYVLRARLREAATRLASQRGKILDVALDCGFADASNFNHAFRAEFGVTPRAFRAGRI